MKMIMRSEKLEAEGEWEEHLLTEKWEGESQFVLLGVKGGDNGSESEACTIFFHFFHYSLLFLRLLPSDKRINNIMKSYYYDKILIYVVF